MLGINSSEHIKAVMGQACLEDNRIMLDGRPAWAWWNEIAVLRQREADARNMMDRAHALMKLCRIKKIEEWQDFDKNILIKITLADMVEYGDNAIEHAKVISG